MTAMRLIYIDENAREFMKKLGSRDLIKVHSLIYDYLSRKRRPLKEEHDIHRIEKNYFKLVTVKFQIYFEIDEKDVMWIADIKANNCN